MSVRAKGAIGKVIFAAKGKETTLRIFTKEINRHENGQRQQIGRAYYCHYGSGPVENRHKKEQSDGKRAKFGGDGHFNF